MGRALLVPDEDVAQLRVATQNAVERKYRTARKSEHDLNTLVEECFADDLAACQFLRHLKCYVPSVIRVGFVACEANPIRLSGINRKSLVLIVAIRTRLIPRYHLDWLADARPANPLSISRNVAYPCGTTRPT